MNPIVKLQTAKSKNGKEYTCLLVQIGDYVGRLFPTPGEVGYIKMLRQQSAHDDFQKAIDEAE